MANIDYGNKNTFQKLVDKIKSKLASVALSGKISDAENDMDFRTIKQVTLAEYNQIPDGEKKSNGVMYMVNDEDHAPVFTKVTMDVLSEYGILSEKKRYIQGKDSVVSPYLSEYNTSYIVTLTEVHVDHLYVNVANSWAEVGEQTLVLENGILGTNYYVQCNTNGVLSITNIREDSDESVCIGGFHYGRIRLSRTVNDLTVGIVPNSIWTLRWAPDCNSPDAMVYIGNKLWGDIYLTRVKTSASNSDGIGAEVQDSSAYGSLPCTGSENFCQFTFTECLARVGKRLPYNDEFIAAADGSPIGLDNSNTNAWTATTNTARTTCGAVANAISFLNIVDLVGNVWKWNADKYELNRPNVNYSWHEVSDVKGDVYGPGDYGLGALCSGGHWFYGSHCGSRCVGVSNWPWGVSVYIGAWAVAAAK